MTIRIKDVEVDYETDLEVSETIAETRQEIKEIRNVYIKKPPIYVATMYSPSLNKEFVSSSFDKKEAMEKAASDYNDATGSRSWPEDSVCYKYVFDERVFS